MNESNWVTLGSDDELVRAIEERKVTRIRSGAAKQEAAQQFVVRGPDILNTIMSDPATHAKHKIDSIRVLDQLAANGPQAVGAESRIVIKRPTAAPMPAM